VPSVDVSDAGCYNAPMSTSPRRRWYQFSLRTMLLTMIVASAVFGYWVHWSKEWIRQRVGILQYRDYFRAQDGNTVAPGGLWLFDEKGIPVLWCPDNQPQTANTLRQLFPEAMVYEYNSGFGYQPD
jgi:hypothetical protein